MIKYAVSPFLILLFSFHLLYANQTTNALEIAAYDNIWSVDAMHDCYYCYVVSPQKHNLNIEIWKQPELYVHDLALQYDTLYIATGPVLKTKNP